MAKIRRCLLPLAVALTLAAPTAVGISYLRDAFREPLRAEGFVGGSPMMAPGICQPPTVAGDRAGLPDDEPVIGVIAGDKARAYRVAALAPMTSHVVNDVVDDMPVSVTYCNRTGCVRVFTGAGRRPLEIWQGGFMEGLMLIGDGRFFWQESGKYVDPRAAEAEGGPALQQVPHTVTNWKAWREAHCDTDVYLGAWPIGP